LASQLPDHTTLLVTAEQVALLDHYFQLARFLQPAILVIEDVDLIARRREDMYGPCDESLLNKLLNEMDGLREDAAVLFVFDRISPCCHVHSSPEATTKAGFNCIFHCPNPAELGNFLRRPPFTPERKRKRLIRSQATKPPLPVIT
jgi:ATPase family protein associated with various cellular activities (AAA)